MSFHKQQKCFGLQPLTPPLIKAPLKNAESWGGAGGIGGEDNVGKVGRISGKILATSLKPEKTTGVLASHADFLRGSSRVTFLPTYHTLQSLYVCDWLVNTLTSTAPIGHGSPIICMWSPAYICQQWERNLSFSSADVRGAGTRDEPLRMSAWEATGVLNVLIICPGSHFQGSANQESFMTKWKLLVASSEKKSYYSGKRSFCEM